MSLVGARRPLAPAAASDLPMSLGRRLSWMVIAALIAVILAVGLTLLLAVPSVRQGQQDYAAANPYRCGHSAAPPAGVACWQGIDGVLVGLSQGSSWTGARRTVASVLAGGVVRDVSVEQAAAASCASSGQAVVLRLQGDAVTSVITPYGVMPTAANPYVDSNLVLGGGLTLVAAASLIPAGLYLAVLRRRKTGEVRGIDALWSSPGMRLCIFVFFLGQGADVATSAIGHQRGLDEGNPLVDTFIRVTGPAGFLLFRLPAVILVLLGLTQVPRRVAMATLVALGLAFCAVGASNAMLAAHAGGPVSCGTALPLP